MTIQKAEKTYHLNMTVPVPYGAHVLDDGVQFTIVSRHATRVWLMLFDDPDTNTPSLEIEMTPEDNRIGDIWHTHVPQARDGQFYLYRMEGPPDGPHARFFNPGQWLLDPYALAVAGSPKWGDPWGYKPGRPVVHGSGFPKGVIIRDTFDWSNDRRPHTPLENSVIYETHVRGFTAHPSSGVGHPGTYRGLIEKIPYLKDLGVTTVELLPIQEFNEMEYYLENMSRTNLRNFWGYSTLAFFAPMGRFAAAGAQGQQLREFQEMVKAMHEAGLEIILDVVFNHTAEGGNGGPIYSFRGIDNSIYYMMDDGHYQNYTGCGNTVNCNHPVVRDFILDCLRYWVLQMHVDGFRFDLASILTRGPRGEVLANPPAVEHIAEDPALRGTKIIAEAWDAAGLYQVGSFPNRHWSEWNGRYRDDIRRFWKGDDSMLRSFATRLIGSPDLYNRENQPPQKSVNFISCHDGFTLNDIVSYSGKHNEANGEENRDGDNHNHSFNYGIEGKTSDSRVLAIRRRQQKNFFATLFLSQGVPMFPAGDEFSRTQQGNNNAYCQDNEISWLDWSFLEKHADLLAFVKEVIAFWKAHPVLQCTQFLNDTVTEEREADIRWFGPANKPVDWDHGKSIACLLHCQDASHECAGDNPLFMIFNASEKGAVFRLPKTAGQPWKIALTTQDTPPPVTKTTGNVRVQERSVNVFVSSL